MSKETKIQDLLITVFLMAICAYVFVAAADFRRTAGHFPRIVAGFTFILLAIQIAANAKAMKSDCVQAGKDDGSSKRFLMAVGGAFLYAFAIELIGYYISTLIYLIATIFVFGYRRKFIVVATSIGLVLFIHLLFAKVLMVKLPDGILF